MADLGFDYNAEDHKPLDSFEPVPPDKYEAMIVDSEVKPTNAGDGELLVLRWRIISGDYENRLVFDRVNLKNPNNEAVAIGQRQLSSICRALGKLRIKDSAELHEIPCIINVKIKAAGPDKKGVFREAQNEIKGYEPIDSGQQQAAPAPAAAAPSRPASFNKPAATSAPARQPATAGAGGKPPWSRK